MGVPYRRVPAPAPRYDPENESQMRSAVEGTLRALAERALTADGLEVLEGANPTMGVATLVAGVATVLTNRVTASSRIFLSVQTPGGTQGFLSAAVASRVAGTSFAIASTSATETSVVAWLLVEPQ